MRILRLYRFTQIDSRNIRQADINKSNIKPELKTALNEITKLLNQNPALTLYGVGHTDNVGKLDTNLKLSADRSAAVVKTLINRGINY